MTSTRLAGVAPADSHATGIRRAGCGLRYAVCWAVLLAGAAACAAAEKEPLSASVRVMVDHTYLRAGPGDDFYPTDRLVSGTMVELWSIDPAGYGAVRPVDGSFSWLRACDVDAAAVAGDAGPPVAGERGVGVIVTNGAVSRVGSQLNDLRHVAQVSLEAGERVQVIEEVRITAGRHAGLWVKIEPPAGEFRWARLADLDLPPKLVPPPPATEETAAAGGSIGETLAAIKEASIALTQAVSDTGGPATLAPSVNPMPSSQPLAAAQPLAPAQPLAVPQPLGIMPQARRLFTGWFPMGTGVFDPAMPVTPVAVGAGAGGVGGAGDELADIDLSLSLAVTGPVEAWNLAPVRERLRQSAARTATDIDRTRVEAIDTRISRFEEIQRRHRTLAAGAPADPDTPLQLGGMWSSLSSLGSRPIRPGVLPGGMSADGQPTWTPPEMTETTGRLATVVSRRPDAPRWAIVDQSNNVIAFITPQTGVNLAPLVGQDVSVRGARGYMPEYKRPYVVASEARMRMAASPEASPDRVRQ